MGEIHAIAEAIRKATISQDVPVRLLKPPLPFLDILGWSIDSGLRAFSTMMGALIGQLPVWFDNGI
jgi:hypothetical protein